VRVEQVHPNHIVSIWPKVEPFLSRALARGQHEYTAEQLKVILICGGQTLLVAYSDLGISGAATIETCRFPNATVAFVTAIGGRGIATQEAFSQLKEWCKKCGHTAIRGAAFPSVARLWEQFGSKEIYRTVEIGL